MHVTTFCTAWLIHELEIENRKPTMPERCVSHEKIEFAWKRSKMRISPKRNGNEWGARGGTHQNENDYWARS